MTGAANVTSRILRLATAMAALALLGACHMAQSPSVAGGTSLEAPTGAEQTSNAMGAPKLEFGAGGGSHGGGAGGGGAGGGGAGGGGAGGGGAGGM
jgi:hypothetical protein